MGGIALGAEGVDVYTATAAGPSTAGALTTVGNTLAEQQQAQATVHDVVPFSQDDPRGAGLASAARPMIFGGIVPAVALTRLFPGHSRLRTRLVGVLAFSLVAGAAVAAFLQFATGSLDGNYWLTSLGLSLGMAALATAFVGLEALLSFAGLGAGAAVMMFLGNPLSGLATGPHWLPAGWAALGQALPPGRFRQPAARQCLLRRHRRSHSRPDPHGLGRPRPCPRTDRRPPRQESADGRRAGRGVRGLNRPRPTITIRSA
ncbi:hypothetical protein [Streptomyces diastaticus]